MHPLKTLLDSELQIGISISDGCIGEIIRTISERFALFFATVR